MPLRSWSQYEARAADAHADDASVITLSDNGWGALVAWLAGPQHTHRMPWNREGATVSVTGERPPGKVVLRGVRPLAAAEAEEIDHDIDSYLTDAGAPPRPRGFAWRLVLPPGIASEDEFWSPLNVALQAEAPEAQHPRDITAALGRILDRLYDAGRLRVGGQAQPGELQLRQRPYGPRLLAQVGAGRVGAEPGQRGQRLVRERSDGEEVEVACGVA